MAGPLNIAKIVAAGGVIRCVVLFSAQSWYFVATSAVPDRPESLDLNRGLPVLGFVDTVIASRVLGDETVEAGPLPEGDHQISSAGGVVSHQWRQQRLSEGTGVFWPHQAEQAAPPEIRKTHGGHADALGYST